MGRSISLFITLAILAIGQTEVNARATQNGANALGGEFPYMGKNIQDVNDPDAFDALIKMLEELEDKLETAIENDTNTINRAMKDIAIEIKKIRADISKQAEEIVRPFLEKLDELENEARQIGISIYDCVGNYYNVIDILPGELEYNVFKCLATKYQEAQTVVEEITSEINATFVEVEGYWRNISACQQKPISEQPTCITELTAVITNDADSIPITIASLISKATEYIANLKKDLLLCTDGKLTELTEKASFIAANVTTCAIAEINSHTSSEAPTTTLGVTTTGQKIN